MTAKPNGRNPSNDLAKMAMTHLDQVVPRADPKDAKEMGFK
jgi:hypothetical protein